MKNSSKLCSSSNSNSWCYNNKTSNRIKQVQWLGMELRLVQSQTLVKCKLLKTWMNSSFSSSKLSFSSNNSNSKACQKEQIWEVEVEFNQQKHMYQPLLESHLKRLELLVLEDQAQDQYTAARREAQTRQEALSMLDLFHSIMVVNHYLLLD